MPSTKKVTGLEGDGVKPRDKPAKSTATKEESVLQNNDRKASAQENAKPAVATTTRLSKLAQQPARGKADGAPAATKPFLKAHGRGKSAAAAETAPEPAPKAVAPSASAAKKPDMSTMASAGAGRGALYRTGGVPAPVPAPAPAPAPTQASGSAASAPVPASGIPVLVRRGSVASTASSTVGRTSVGGRAASVPPARPVDSRFGYVPSSGYGARTSVGGATTTSSIARRPSFTGAFASHHAVAAEAAAVASATMAGRMSVADLVPPASRPSSVSTLGSSQFGTSSRVAGAAGAGVGARRASLPSGLASSSSLAASGSLAVFDKNLLAVLTSSISEANALMDSGKGSEALSVFLQLGVDLPAARLKAVYWASLAALHEREGAFKAALEVYLSGIDACAGNALEVTMLSAGVRRMSELLARHAAAVHTTEQAPVLQGGTASAAAATSSTPVAVKSAGKGRSSAARPASASAPSAAGSQQHGEDVLVASVLGHALRSATAAPSVAAPASARKSLALAPSSAVVTSPSFASAAAAGLSSSGAGTGSGLLSLSASGSGKATAISAHRSTEKKGSRVKTPGSTGSAISLPYHPEHETQASLAMSAVTPAVRASLAALTPAVALALGLAEGLDDASKQGMSSAKKGGMQPSSHAVGLASLTSPARSALKAASALKAGGRSTGKAPGTEGRGAASRVSFGGASRLAFDKNTSAFIVGLGVAAGAEEEVDMKPAAALGSSASSHGRRASMSSIGRGKRSSTGSGVGVRTPDSAAEPPAVQEAYRTLDTIRAKKRTRARVHTEDAVEEQEEEVGAGAAIALQAYSTVPVAVLATSSAGSKRSRTASAAATSTSSASGSSQPGLEHEAPRSAGAASTTSTYNPLRFSMGLLGFEAKRRSLFRQDSGLSSMHQDDDHGNDEGDDGADGDLGEEDMPEAEQSVVSSASKAARQAMKPSRVPASGAPQGGRQVRVTGPKRAKQGGRSHHPTAPPSAAPIQMGTAMVPALIAYSLQDTARGEALVLQAEASVLVAAATGQQASTAHAHAGLASARKSLAASRLSVAGRAAIAPATIRRSVRIHRTAVKSALLHSAVKGGGLGGTARPAGEAAFPMSAGGPKSTKKARFADSTEDGEEDTELLQALHGVSQTPLACVRQGGGAGTGGMEGGMDLTLTSLLACAASQARNPLLRSALRTARDMAAARMYTGHTSMGMGMGMGMPVGVGMGMGMATPGLTMTGTGTGTGGGVGAVPAAPMSLGKLLGGYTATSGKSRGRASSARKSAYDEDEDEDDDEEDLPAQRLWESGYSSKASGMSQASGSQLFYDSFHRHLSASASQLGLSASALAQSVAKAAESRAAMEEVDAEAMQVEEDDDNDEEGEGGRYGARSSSKKLKLSHASSTASGRSLVLDKSTGLPLVRQLTQTHAQAGYQGWAAPNALGLQSGAGLDAPEAAVGLHGTPHSQPPVSLAMPVLGRGDASLLDALAQALSGNEQAAASLFGTVDADAVLSPSWTGSYSTSAKHALLSASGKASASVPVSAPAAAVIAEVAAFMAVESVGLPTLGAAVQEGAEYLGMQGSQADDEDVEMEYMAQDV